MVRSNREIVEEKLQNASQLTPGEREILQVRAQVMIVDVLERIWGLLAEDAERDAHERTVDLDMPR